MSDYTKPSKATPTKEKVRLYNAWYRKTHKQEIIEYRKRTRDIYNPMIKNWYDNLKRKFFELYGNSCKCCGETIKEFLTLEHVGGLVGKKRESSHKIYGKAVKEYRPDLYEVLCMNCNHSKGVRGYCPHQRIEDEL